jgi:16S rRNA (cytidine1402-2'-O)-methyltransferase
MTLRARETLKKVNAVVCEDTRVTGNLMHLLGIEKKELIAFHGHSADSKGAWIMSRLQNGEHLALVSDAGTPGISDPGYAVVSKAMEAKIPVEVVPGPAAFLAALSASGLPINRFRYLGFLPMKKGRRTLLASLLEEECTVVFYESVHRIERTLLEIAAALASDPERRVVIARELTKVHEEILHTCIANLPACANALTKKGEFVVVLGPKP